MKLADKRKPPPTGSLGAFHGLADECNSGVEPHRTQAEKPPSMVRLAPVTYAASGPAR